MSRVSVKKTQLQFQAVLQQLESKLGQLRSRREAMDTQVFVVVEEDAASPHGPDPNTASSTLGEQTELYHGGEVFKQN